MTAVKQLKDYYYKEMKLHSQFENLKHFNKYTGKLRYYFKDKLNNTDYTLIDYLAKHAVKAATGVACPKVMTMAKAINRSVDTVSRIIRKLENLGIIKRLYNMRAKKGGNGANFYIFQKDAIPTLEDPNTGALIQGRSCRESIDDSKVKDKKYQCKTNINLKLNKDLKIEKEDQLNLFVFQDLLDYKHIGIRLVNVYGTKRANKLWQRIVWAFQNSELYKEAGLYYLQDLLNDDENFERKIAHMIANCTQKYKNNSVNKTFEGYLYTAALGLFNNIAVKIIKERTTIKNTPISPDSFLLWSNSHYIEKEEALKRETERHEYIEEFYGEDWTLELYRR